VAFATLWFFVTLAPESTFVALAEVMNDHRPYIASSLGLSVLLAWALYTIAARLGRWRTPAFVVVCVILCVVAVPVNRYRNWLWQDSVRLWQDAVITGLGNPRAWMNAGKALMDRGQYAEARVYLERAREIAPNYSFAYLNLSALERLMGNPQGALREAEAAVRVGPRFSMAHYFHGFALENLGARDKAKEAYELALQLNPNEPDAREALVRLKTTNADAADMKVGVQALYVDRDAERAAAIFRTVFTRNPSHYGATLQLAKALDRAGKRQEAQPLWEKMLGMADAAKDNETLATVRARLAEPAGSSPTPRQAAGSPTVPAEDFMKAGLEALYQRNDPVTAATQFRKVLAANPSHYGATLQLAKALDRAGKRQEAQPLWEKILGMAEAAKDQETLATVRARLAGPAGSSPAEDVMKAGLDALYQRNDPVAAATQFWKVLAANPSHYGATLQLAKALDRAGKRQEAQPLWEKMLGMAEAARDQETLRTVRARLAEKS
jgi:tetratricopeptide (TPR) repeat protein